MLFFLIWWTISGVAGGNGGENDVDGGCDFLSKLTNQLQCKGELLQLNGRGVDEHFLKIMEIPSSSFLLLGKATAAPEQMYSV